MQILGSALLLKEQVKSLFEVGPEPEPEIANCQLRFDFDDV
jgi:hypothetical protein